MVSETSVEAAAGPGPGPLAQETSATLSALRARVPALKRQWEAGRPFRYVVVDDFLPRDIAAGILASYPKPDIEGWDKLTYTHQKRKFTMRSGFPAPVDRFFAISALPAFRDTLAEITGIPRLLADPELVGGGLHQILRGGFLDVHVDYNFHPTSKLHRRLNLLLYMNPDWKPEYQGYLELWDRGTEKRQLENIAPFYNRAVIFETNEVSFHGHPQPLETPPGVTRKSLALYYYTAERDSVAPEHNTLYQQSTGLRGYVKTAVSSAEALVERVREQGPRAVAREVGDKIYRKLRGLPPVNR
jgi:hypothetical protein